MIKKIIILIALLLIPSTSNAEVLVFVTKWCEYCQDIKIYAQELKNDGYDIKIIDANLRINKELVKKYKITTVPTTVKVSCCGTEKYTGTLSKKELRKLCKDCKCLEPFTGAILILDSGVELDITTAFFVRRAKKNRYGCKIIDIKNKTASEKQAIRKKYNTEYCPTIIIMEDGKELGRYVCTQHPIETEQ